jgi:MerR family transcriptional regulator, light-induced transcriptional regulator
VETLYPIRAVAKITGLPIDTLRAWERRYQAVVPEHSARGRQYGPAQVERLLLLGQLVRRGHAIGGIASHSDKTLQDLLQNQPATAVHVQPAAILDPILAAIESFDSDRARTELSRIAAVLAPPELLYQVVLPLMREVGVRWYNGTFAIAQEHLVSGMLRNLLGSMLQLLKPRGAGVKVILATPPGEPHEFGILASAMLASMAGIEPVYLGPNLPAREIGDAAKKVGAKVVVLGITIPSESTSNDVRVVAESMPAAAELWLGGRASGELDLSGLERKIAVIQDLAEFEQACQRFL